MDEPTDQTGSLYRDKFKFVATDYFGSLERCRKLRETSG